jgi:hypothetical protein
MGHTKLCVEKSLFGGEQAFLNVLGATGSLSLSAALIKTTGEAGFGKISLLDGAVIAISEPSSSYGGGKRGALRQMQAGGCRNLLAGKELFQTRLPLEKRTPKMKDFPRKGGLGLCINELRRRHVLIEKRN